MDESTKKLLWVGGGVLLVAGAYAAGFKRGFRRAELNASPTAITPLPAPPAVTQVSVKGPTAVPLNLIPGAQSVNVPTGSSLQVYPPDANSMLLTFSTAAGSVTPVTSPQGPQAFTIRGSGAIAVTWQDASRNAQSSTIAVTAT